MNTFLAVIDPEDGNDYWTAVQSAPTLAQLKQKTEYTAGSDDQFAKNAGDKLLEGTLMLNETISNERTETKMISLAQETNLADFSFQVAPGNVLKVSKKFTSLRKLKKALKKQRELKKNKEGGNEK